METAKVDIRKLQLLNDRINQCIDALSQVRLSVHGLTSAPNAALGIGAGVGVGQGSIGLSHTGASGNPFAQGIGMMNPGLAQAFGASPFAQHFGASPYGQMPGTSPYGQVPIAQNPYLSSVTPGLSHTTGAWAPAAFAQGVNPWAGISPYGSEGQEAYGRTGTLDPLLTARIAQTFPYAQFPAPPVISLY